MKTISKVYLFLCFIFLITACKKSEQNETYLNELQGVWTLDSVQKYFNAGFPPGHPSYSESNITNFFDTITYIIPSYSEVSDFMYCSYIENDTTNSRYNTEFIAKLEITEVVNDTLIKYKISNYSDYIYIYDTDEMDMIMKFASNNIEFTLSGRQYLGQGHLGVFSKKYYFSR